MQSPKRLSPDSSFEEKRALFAERWGFLSCKYLRKQDCELSIFVRAPSESIRCDLMSVTSWRDLNGVRHDVTHCRDDSPCRCWAFPLRTCRLSWVGRRALPRTAAARFCCSLFCSRHKVERRAWLADPGLSPSERWRCRQRLQATKTPTTLHYTYTAGTDKIRIWYSGASRFFRRPRADFSSHLNGRANLAESFDEKLKQLPQSSRAKSGLQRESFIAYPDTQSINLRREASCS